MKLKLRFQHTIAYLTQLKFPSLLLRAAVKIVVPRRRFGAGVVVINNTGQVLILKHAFHGKHPWGLPGGWLNRAESPLEGAIRELQEETGLTATFQRIVFLGLSEIPPDLNAYYLATNPQGTLKLSYEIIEAGWYDPDDLPRPMRQHTRHVIESALLIYSETVG